MSTSPQSRSRAKAARSGSETWVPPWQACGVPHVGVRGRDVEVAPEHERRARVRRLGQPAGEPVEPGQLGLVEDGVDAPAVGRVEGHDAHAAARGGDHPRLGERLVVARVLGAGGAQRRAEVRHHVRDARAARDGDAVPPALPVMRQGVAGALEDVGRGVRVPELRLLHQEHVRLGALEPQDDPLQAGLQRVDVPGRDPHGSRLPRVGAAARAKDSFRSSQVPVPTDSTVPARASSYYTLRP